MIPLLVSNYPLFPAASALVCSCGWSTPIPDDSSLHWTIAEYLPQCPNRHWWNGWRHRMRTTMHVVEGTEA